jgi:hypothetical protein
MRGTEKSEVRIAMITNQRGEIQNTEGKTRRAVRRIGMARGNSVEPLLVGVGLVLLSSWLASSPKCNEGCQTLAEHLFKYGIRLLRGM